MCICVNCDLLVFCSLYQTIEILHKESLSFELDQIVEFEPRKSNIIVNINSSENSIKHEWDVISCESFVLNLSKYNVS
uniref:Uncharacterized protein ycf34 n=1 Tax=Cyanophora paradoxa TaxID=2762 RepID=YCF34_CYAPA|nr:hypothetical protein CypaCp008 [Cyanophora paradoxa]P48274.1 RecName: Full=Uncharacterized protein ycf34 [Cyanophora paradoxa]AAA81176.1 ycf34 [Cyanophora paradoxa]